MQRGELKKLRCGGASLAGISARDGSRVVQRVLPEMTPLAGCEQEPEWHPEGDVWTHTLLVIDQARRLNGDLDRARLATVMLGAVCHDLGKPATTARIDGRIRSLDHEQAGVAPTLTLLDRLNVHSIDGSTFEARSGPWPITPSPGGSARPARGDGASGGWRRRLISVTRPGWHARIVWGERSTARRWTGSSTCARARCRAPPPRCCFGRHLLALASRQDHRWQDPGNGLREATRRRGGDARSRHRRGASVMVAVAVAVALPTSRDFSSRSRPARHSSRSRRRARASRSWRAPRRRWPRRSARRRGSRDRRANSPAGDLALVHRDDARAPTGAGEGESPGRTGKQPSAMLAVVGSA